MKISIIIPTFNRKDFIRNLLFQLKNQIDLIDDVDFEQVVVVDGSTDGTHEMLKNDFPNVHVVTGDGNWWYTKSMNEGFKYAIINLNPDFVLTLNDDVLLANDYLIEMLKSIEKTDSDTIIGSVGITTEQPYRMVSSGNSIRNKWLGLYNLHIPFLSEVNLNDLSGIHPSITLPGRGMLIPAKILKDLSGFDERFKQYNSDGDFTLRAVKMGYTVSINWDTKIFVEVEKTSTSSSFLNKSPRLLVKSFFNPVSRNYIPDKFFLYARHGSLFFLPIKLLLFIAISFRNLFVKKKLSK